MAHDSDPSEDGATGVRGVGRELADAVRRDWRGVLVAAIGALLGLLLADVLGDSQDARTLAAVAGAAGATWFKGISDRLRWRERTLAATAGVLGAVAMPSARRYVLEAARSAATTGAPTTSAATTIAVTAIGAAAVVVGDLAVGDRSATPGPALAVDFEHVDGRRVAGGMEGALRGDVRIVDAGAAGRAAAFSGSAAQAVDFGDVLDLTGAMTVEAWALPRRALRGWDTVVSNWTGGEGYWLGGSQSPGGVEWWIDDVHADADRPLARGRWQHLAGTFDAGTGRLMLYIDGRPVATARHPGRASGSDASLMLGSGGDSFKVWAGLIDDVKIWRAVRSAADICADAGRELDSRAGCGQPR